MKSRRYSVVQVHVIDSLEFENSLVLDVLAAAIARGGFCEVELLAPPLAVNVHVTGHAL